MDVSYLIQAIILGISVIVAAIGLYFVIKIWIVWKRVDKELLKARVFLSNNFLMKNWIHVFFISAFVMIRRIIEFLDLLNFWGKSEDVTSLALVYLFHLMGLAVIILLVRFVHYWYKLIYSAIPNSKIIRE